MNDSPTPDAEARGAWAAALEEASVPGYRAEALLGRGGQGTVHRAVQASTGRRVALKRIRRDESSRAAFERFQRERELICRLRHPHVVSVLDSGVDGGTQWIAMELVEGATLEDWLRERPDPTREEAARLMLPLCDAVAHAHRAGVTHRDLKPENVLMQRMEGPQAAWAPKIADFGLARALEGADPHFATMRAEDRLSSLAYSAPELLGDAPAPPDTRCDVFGLGALLYRMLAGEDPRRGLSFEEARATSGPAPYRGFAGRRLAGRAVGRDLQAITFQAMAPSPDERYATVQDLAADLRRFLEGRPVHAVPRSLRYVLGKSLRRQRAAWLLGAAAVLAAAGGLIAWTAQAERTREQATRTTAAVIGHAREVDRMVIAMIRPVQRALGTDEVALSVMRGLIASREAMTAEYGESPELWRGLADLRRTHGDLLHEAGRYVESRAEFEAALSILVERLDPSSDPVLDADATVLRVRVADAIKPFDPEEALRRYEAALEADRARLAAHGAHPEAARFADDLAWSLDRVAWLSLAQGFARASTPVRRESPEVLGLADRFHAFAEECSTLAPFVQGDERRALDVALVEVQLRRITLLARGLLEEEIPEYGARIAALRAQSLEADGLSLRTELAALSARHLEIFCAAHERKPGWVEAAHALLSDFDAIQERTGHPDAALAQGNALLQLALNGRFEAEITATRRAWLEKGVQLLETTRIERQANHDVPYSLVLLKAQLALELGDEEPERAAALLASARAEMAEHRADEARFAHLERRLRHLFEHPPEPRPRSEAVWTACREFEAFLDAGPPAASPEPTAF